MLKENCFNYTKTDLYKLRREELLKVLYEQTVFYYESVSGYDKNWSKIHNFEEFKERHEVFTCKDLREKITTL